MQPAVLVSVLFLFPSVFPAHVSGNGKYRMSARSAARVGAADTGSRSCLRENPFRLRFARVGALLESSGQQREHGEQNRVFQS